MHPITVYNRKQASGKLAQVYRRYFVPSAAEIPRDVEDATEYALKDVLPGFRVRVTVEPMAVQQQEAGMR